MTSGQFSDEFRIDSSPCPSIAELTEIMDLNERFHGHRIYWDQRGQYRVRYLAFATSPGVRPHTIITNDLAELRNELERAVGDG